MDGFQKGCLKGKKKVTDRIPDVFKHIDTFMFLLKDLRMNEQQKQKTKQL